MADGVTLPGTGEVVAADDCGATGKVQLFKLAYSADGVATLVACDVNGLTVQSPDATKFLVTANAGTNLNTSALALEAGNLATAVTRLTSILAQFDVALSTRTKPADQQHAIIDSGSVTATNAFALEATLQSVKTAVETIDNFISGTKGLVTEDNSAAIAASLSVLDDWDETDRAKVNPIAGQAGVQGGAGASTALTQRVALATDANTVAVSNAFALEATQLLQATASKQDTGNTSLGTIKTNTDPLVTVGGGGYVRQDSTGSIAKETGGNLATIATNTTGVATAANQATEIASLASLVTQTDAVEGSLASMDAKLSTVGNGSLDQLLLLILIEMRLMNVAITNGFNCVDEVDAYRNDPSLSQVN